MYLLSELVEDYCIYGLLVWIWTLTKCPDSTSYFPQSLHHILTYSEVYCRLTFLTGAWVKAVHAYSLGESRACLKLGWRLCMRTAWVKAVHTYSLREGHACVQLGWRPCRRTAPQYVRSVNFSVKIASNDRNVVGWDSTIWHVLSFDRIGLWFLHWEHMHW
jgi:hypothetical protein